MPCLDGHIVNYVNAAQQFAFGGSLHSFSHLSKFNICFWYSVCTKNGDLRKLYATNWLTILFSNLHAIGEARGSPVP